MVARGIWRGGWLAGPLLLTLSVAAADDVASAIATLRSVGKEGAGNLQAQQAWQVVASAPANAIPTILEGMNQANPVAANYLHTALSAMVESAQRQKQSFPIAAIEAYVTNRANDAKARRIAFELLARLDPGADERLIPTMADDPSVELRRDAVARLLATAEKLDEQNKSSAKNDDESGRRAVLDAYRKALSAARDRDQIDQAANRLAELGADVDLARHFGFILDWHLIGPFDNTEFAGFDVAYPPESAVALGAEYPGKGTTVRWIPFTTDDPYGKVDLNKALGKHKWSTAYARTTFVSDSERPVEFRLGCITAWKLWLNGELLFARDEYHKGIDVDQYRVPGRLRAGTNEIVLKVCQNNQQEEWAQEWQFQLRVCDATGTAVLSTARPAIATRLRRPEAKPAAGTAKKASTAPKASPKKKKG